MYLNNISNSNLQNLNITNLDLVSKNFYNGSPIFKKPNTNFKINNMDILKNYILISKNNRMRVLYLGFECVKKKLSVEELLRKILGVDKLKFINY